MSAQRICLDHVFSEENIACAMRIMTRKDKTPGLDGMRTCELDSFWRINRRRILSEIERGIYTPVPLRQFYIRKPGKQERRRISVCSVLDQMLQHCIRFEMERLFVPRFHPDSYGFIKKRNAGQALSRCLQHMNTGQTYAVDADIRKCFDNIKHRIVISLLERAGCDRQVVLLIEKYLKNPGVSGNSIRHNRVGLPQGSSLSPVLCNLVLNRLDWHLDRTNRKFVRYADDLVVFCSTEDEANEARCDIEQYLTGYLSLQLNAEKTTVCPSEQLRFLSHAFIKRDRHYELAMDEKTADKMKMNLMRHIRRSSPHIGERLNRLGAFHRGWMNYYAGINAEDMGRIISDVNEIEKRRLLQKSETGHTTTAAPYREILCSTGYITMGDWYDELKERGIVYGKQ